MEILELLIAAIKSGEKSDARRVNLEKAEKLISEMKEEKELENGSN